LLTGLPREEFFQNGNVAAHQIGVASFALIRSSFTTRTEGDLLAENDAAAKEPLKLQQGVLKAVGSALTVLVHHIFTNSEALEFLRGFQISEPTGFDLKSISQLSRTLCLTTGDIAVSHRVTDCGLEGPTVEDILEFKSLRKSKTAVGEEVKEDGSEFAGFLLSLSPSCDEKVARGL